MSEVREAEASVILEAAEKFYAAEHTTFKQEGGDDLDLAIVPTGRRIENVSAMLDKRRHAPRRRTGTATVTALQSLIDHANRFKDDGSVLFCDERGPELQCVLDYHHKGSEGAPRFGEHVSSYRFPLSDEYRAWSSDDLGRLGQGDFAEFLEDHLGDVIDPASAPETIRARFDALGMKLATPAELLTLSRGLTVHVGAKIKNHKNLSSGEGEVSFEESHQGADGKPIRIPGAFVIAIPVFQRAEQFDALAVRLRYRARAGDVTWTLEVHRADSALRESLEEACNKAAADTGLPLFYGTPE